MTDDSVFKNTTALFHTFGCKLNFAETSTVARTFAEAGIRRVQTGETPDFIVVNTCSVTEVADKKCRQAIRSLHRRYPEAAILVTGCYAPNSLSHTKWNCKYHIVFAPKYRRQVVYRQIKADIGRIIRQLCEMKKVEIIEAEACPDHIHMLVSIPPNISVSQFVGYLKGKSSLMIFDRHANLKYKYGNRHFWCRGYYVDTVGRNKERIAEYIRHQLDEDIMADQLSFKEYIDPFTGSKNPKA